MNDGNHGQRTRSAKKGSDGSAENTPNTSKFIRPIYPIGLKFWDIDEKGFIVSGLYHQENASTLWAFNVNEKMQILPLHIKSIVNLNFTRAHESTSPNACTRRCGAAVPPPPRSPAAGFINIFL